MNKSLLIKNYIEKLAYPISDKDIIKYFGIEGQEAIILYKDLKNYKNIEELLPTNNSFKIFLIEDKPNSGHWVCLLRYGDNIEFFDSYGEGIDEEFKYIPKFIKNMLNQNKKYLTYLLANAPKKYKIIYNKIPYQELNDGVSTCGKWCILRILLLKTMNYDLYEFNEFMERQKFKYNKPFDILCVDWIV